MNREQRRANLKAIGGQKKVNDPNRSVTRQELVDAITQVGDNVGQVQQGLVDAVNTMYANQVFPVQLETTALEKLLIKKGIITQEEIDAQVEEHKQDILNRAEQIKENAEGKLEKVSKEEADENEKKAIVKASAANSRKKKEEKSKES